MLIDSLNPIEVHSQLYWWVDLNELYKGTEMDKDCNPMLAVKRWRLLLEV